MPIVDKNSLNKRRFFLKNEDEKLRQEEELLANEPNKHSNNETNNSTDEEKVHEELDEEQKNKNDEDSEKEGKEDSEEEKDENSEEKDDKEKDSEESSEENNESSKLNDAESRKNLSKRNDDGNADKESSSKGIKDKVIDNSLDKAREKSKTVDTAIKAKQLATRAAAAMKNLTAAGGFLAKLIVNPVFWIGVAAIGLCAVIMISISSTTSIIGGNDYNQSCDFNGVGSVNVAEDADDFTRQSAIASWLMSTPFEVLGNKPMSREQTMGVMGNLMKESYGANPKAIQGDHSLTMWQTCGNDCVGAFVGGGKAVGILQWDGNAGDPRRDNLVKLARAEGKEWYDLNVQLKHLKNELDGIGDHTYENYQIKRSGFLDPGKSIDEYTVIWAEYIERCGKCMNEQRIASAHEFNANFQGGGGGGVGSLSTQCVTSGNIDSSSLVQLALQISYSREEKAAGLGYGVCASGAGCGQTFSKPEYITAKQMAEDQTGADGFPGMLASCDRLAATLYRVTGIDVNFPYGASGTQLAYARANWKQVSCQERQPGDAIIRPGHIMVYIGMVDGRDTISSASIAMADRVGPNGKGRSAHLSDMSCKGDKWYADGGTAEGFRKVD